MFLRRPAPFRWILPLGQLTLCWFLIAIIFVFPINFTYHHNVLALVRSINVPGAVVQLPITISRTDHTDWHPATMPQDMWRAISWPVLALVFWWIAGRAVEALNALRYHQIRPRISVVEAVFGFLWVALGVVLIGGTLLFERAKIYSDLEIALLPIAGGLWAVLGSLSVVARFRQWRLRRALAKAATAQ